MMIGGRDMTPPRAVASMEDLIALAHAVHSGTLEKDTKAFVDAAKKAGVAEASAQTALTALETREAALSKKEKSCESRTKTLATDRNTLSKDRADWKALKEAEDADLRDARTQLDVAVKAVKEREDRATAKAAEAQSAMEQAQKTEALGKKMKSEFQSKLARLKEIA